jgi:predicted amidohydrolase
MAGGRLKIATVQSQITPDVRRNGRLVRRLLARAAEAGARLAHFPEAAMSGYVKAEIKDWAAVDWAALREELEETAALAGRLGIWLVLGANHRLTPPGRPHNSLYIVADTGKLAGRYDKRRCSNTEITDWYAPGREPAIFAVDGFRFGCALCIEIRFADLFADYEQAGVDCMLVSAYADDPMMGITAQAHAAMNLYWLSLSTPQQCSHGRAGGGLPAGLIAPTGRYAARCRPGRSTLVIHEMDKEAPELDLWLNRARPWRRAARAGSIYDTYRPGDPRSTDRLSF